MELVIMDPYTSESVYTPLNRNPDQEDLRPYQPMSDHSADTSLDSDWEKCRIDVASLTEDPVPVGSGGFGSVFKGSYHGETVAIKRLRSGDSGGSGMMTPGTHFGHETLLSYRREMQVLRTISNENHPNVVRFLGGDASPDQLLLVLGYAQRGSLRGLLKDHLLPPNKHLTALRDIAKGMEFLHSRKIIHRDLTSMNVLVDEDYTCMVTDFGISREATPEHSMTMGAGNIRWRAPEVVTSTHYDNKCDVFSYSLIMYDVFHHRVPFDQLGHEMASYDMVVGKRPPVDTSLVPRPVLELMQQCWSAEPRERPTFGEIVQRLEEIIATQSDLEELDMTLLEKDTSRCLGRGGFGTVWQAKYRGIPVALKEIQLPADSTDKSTIYKQVLREMEVYRHTLLMRCSNLRSPHLLPCFGANFNPPRISIVLALAPHGTLRDVIEQKKLPAEKRLDALLDVARGMEFLHTQREPILHRDLCSMNVLVFDDFACKLSDFGMARSASAGGVHMTQGPGHLRWTAPECFQSAPYDEKCDVYSFAMIMYDVYHGRVPYSDNKAEAGLLARAMKGQRPEISPEIPPEIGAFMTLCWDQDPNTRPTFPQIVQRLMQIGGHTPSAPVAFSSKDGGITLSGVTSVAAGISQINIGASVDSGAFPVSLPHLHSVSTSIPPPPSTVIPPPPNIFGNQGSSPHPMSRSAGDYAYTPLHRSPAAPLSAPVPLFTTPPPPPPPSHVVYSSASSGISSSGITSSGITSSGISVIPSPPVSQPNLMFSSTPSPSESRYVSYAPGGFVQPRPEVLNPSGYVPQPPSSGFVPPPPPSTSSFYPSSGLSVQPGYLPQGAPSGGFIPTSTPSISPYITTPGVSSQGPPTVIYTGVSQPTYTPQPVYTPSLHNAPSNPSGYGSSPRPVVPQPYGDPFAPSTKPYVPPTVQTTTPSGKQMCSHGSGCPDQSPQHMTQYIHVCRYGSLCRMLGRGEKRHIEMFYHPPS